MGGFIIGKEEWQEGKEYNSITSVSLLIARVSSTKAGSYSFQ